MPFIERLWRWLGDNLARLLAVGAVVGIGASVATGAFQGWLKFPFPIKVAGVIGVVALWALLVRTWPTWRPWLLGLLKPPTQAPALMSLGHAETGGSINVGHSVMSVGPLPRPTLPAVISSTPATLRRRSEAVGKLALALDAFFAERRAGHDHLWEQGIQDQRQYDRETGALFREFDAEILEVFEDARARGFTESDSALDRAIQIAAQMGGYAPMQYAEIIQRLKVIALQMNERAVQIDERG